MPKNSDLDFRKESFSAKGAGRGEKMAMGDVGQHSPAWAGITQPFAIFVFTLVAAVIAIPFVLMVFIDHNRIVTVLDWSKTVFPPVVGFASAVVGYYFGTRGSLNKEDGDKD